MGNGSRSSDLTPITDMRGMGEALVIIRRDVSEIKPEVKETARAVVELATKQRVTDKRIKTLEATTGRLDRKTVALSSPQPHGCINVDKINDLDEENKQQALDVLEVKKDAMAANVHIDDLKKSQSKFIYWLLAAAVIAFGSVTAWYASYQVTTNEVGHLVSEQTKLRESVESLQKTTKALPIVLNNVTERVEKAAKTIETKNSDNQGVQLKEVWCILSEREKAKLKGQLSADKIPTQRCR